MSQEVFTRYWTHINSRRAFCRSVTRNETIKSFTDILFDHQKFEWVHPVGRVTGGFHRKDEHVVTAACCKRGAVLVTLDRRLMRQLAATQILEEHEFEIMHAEEAVEML
jgi:predicted nucleic acid-binding protein